MDEPLFQTPSDESADIRLRMRYLCVTVLSEVDEERGAEARAGNMAVPNGGAALHVSP